MGKKSITLEFDEDLLSFIEENKLPGYSLNEALTSIVVETVDRIRAMADGNPSGVRMVEMTVDDLPEELRKFVTDIQSALENGEPLPPEFQISGDLSFPQEPLVNSHKPLVTDGNVVHFPKQIKPS